MARMERSVFDIKELIRQLRLGQQMPKKIVDTGLFQQERLVIDSTYGEKDLPKEIGKVSLDFRNGINEFLWGHGKQIRCPSIYRFPTAHCTTRAFFSQSHEAYFEFLCPLIQDRHPECILYQ